MLSTCVLDWLFVIGLLSNDFIIWRKCVRNPILRAGEIVNLPSAKTSWVKHRYNLIRNHINWLIDAENIQSALIYIKY